MNPMMKTLLEELTQVRERQARPVLPAGGMGALPERPRDSELSLPKGRVGADPVQAVVDLPGGKRASHAHG